MWTDLEFNEDDELLLLGYKSRERTAGVGSILVGSFLLLENDSGAGTSVLLLESDAGAQVDGLLLESST